LTSIVLRYDKFKKDAIENKRNMKKGDLKMIIAEGKKEFGLEVIHISEETI